MSQFDIFFDEYEIKHNCSPEKRECFEAGAQSKQQEVDELQQKIAKALYLINMCEGHCSVDSIRKILEGESHES